MKLLASGSKGRNLRDLACTQEAVAATIQQKGFINWNVSFVGCLFSLLLVSVLFGQSHQTCAGNLKQQKKKH